MRAAIHALKYDRIHPAAQRLGAMLASAIAQLAPEAPAELLVVPVPLHRTQAAESAASTRPAPSREYAIRRTRTNRIPRWQLKLAPATLMRLRSTESQAGLTPRQRRLNVRGAFNVSDPSAVQGPAHPARGRHSYHRCYRPRRRPVSDQSWSSFRLRRHSRPCAPHPHQPRAVHSTDRAQPGIEPAAVQQLASMHSPSSIHINLFNEGKRMSLGKAMIHARKQKSARPRRRSCC